MRRALRPAVAVDAGLGEERTAPERPGEVVPRDRIARRPHVVRRDVGAAGRNRDRSAEHDGLPPVALDVFRRRPGRRQAPAVRSPQAGGLAPGLVVGLEVADPDDPAGDRRPKTGSDLDAAGPVLTRVRRMVSGLPERIDPDGRGPARRGPARDEQPRHEDESRGHAEASQDPGARTRTACTRQDGIVWHVAEPPEGLVTLDRIRANRVFNDLGRNAQMQ